MLPDSLSGVQKVCHTAAVRHPGGGLLKVVDQVMDLRHHLGADADDVVSPFLVEVDDVLMG